MSHVDPLGQRQEFALMINWAKRFVTSLASIEVALDGMAIDMPPGAHA